MISNGQNKQLPNELTSTFKELQVLKYLRKSWYYKVFGLFLWLPFPINFLFDL
jgi:hypothetical protein